MWTLIFFFLVTPFYMWTPTGGNNLTADECMKAGAVKYEQMQGDLKPPTIDWFCYGPNGEVRGPQR